MPAASVDAYFAALPPDQRAALDALEAVILAAAPGAERCMSYGMPGYRLNGLLVWVGAAKGHCALYPKGLDPAFVHRFAAELEGFSLSKGTIRFTPERPIPDAVVTAIVAQRVAEDRARAAAKSGAGKSSGAKSRVAKSGVAKSRAARS